MSKYYGITLYKHYFLFIFVDPFLYNLIQINQQQHLNNVKRVHKYDKKLMFRQHWQTMLNKCAHWDISIGGTPPHSTHILFVSQSPPNTSLCLASPLLNLKWTTKEPLSGDWHHGTFFGSFWKNQLNKPLGNNDSAPTNSADAQQLSNVHWFQYYIQVFFNCLLPKDPNLRL